METKRRNKQKKMFVIPEVEIIELRTSDFIITSGPGNGDDDPENKNDI